MNYKSCISYINKEWISNKFLFIQTLVIPFLLNLILSFTIEINNLLFVSMMNFMLFINVLALPIFMSKIRNNKIDFFNEWSESWKLTYWISLYFFIYSLITSIVGMAISISFSAISYATTNMFNFFTFYINNIKFISWFESFFYIGYSAIVSISLSFLINSFVKKINNVVIISFIIFLFNFFFIGNIPFDHYLCNDTFWGIKFLSLFSYLSVNGWIAFNNGGAFLFESNFYEYTNHMEKLMNFTVPFIVISICCGLSSHFYRWNNKQPINKYSEGINISFKKVIINIIWVFISFAIVLVGVVFLVLANHESILSINNSKYIIGSIFTILGIINTSLAAGYLVKNLYLKIFNKKLKMQISIS